MSFPKFLLAGAVGASVGASSLAAQAQNVAVAPAPGFTTVDANGNMVRSPAPDATTLGARPTAGTVSSDRSHRGNGRGTGRGDTVRYGGAYYGPANPYYPYSYPAPTYNNYYYPAQPSTTIIGTPAFPWSRPNTITNIPLGGTYGYGTPGYPVPGYGYPAPAYGYPTTTYSYPAVPGYGVPVYGVPGYGVPGYGYPAYPGLPYPGYGTTTTVFGNVPGAIFSQSQTSGYGFSIGQGGVSIQLGNRRSSSSTTVSRP